MPDHAVERPEPAHALRSAALLVDAARRPVAAVDGEVLAVLMDRRRPVGRMVRGIAVTAVCLLTPAFRWPRIPPAAFLGFSRDFGCNDSRVCVGIDHFLMNLCPLRADRTYCPHRCFELGIGRHLPPLTEIS